MRYTSLKALKHVKELRKDTGWAWDTETKDALKGKELFCWSLAVGKSGKNRSEKVYSGKTIDSFYKILQELNDTKKKRTIWVHNLSFDVRFLIDFALRKKIKFKPIIVNSNVILFYFSDLNYRFVDSFQFLLSSQDEAEKLFDVPLEYRKINCDTIFSTDFKNWSKSDKQRVIAHNKNDVIALRIIMQRYRKIMFDIANTDILSCNTLAGFSLKAFRKTIETPIVNGYIQEEFMPNEKKFRYVLDEEKYKFAKESYFGGRTECFNHNIGYNVNYYDVVSMFPTQMRFKEFPLGIPYWETDSDKISESLDTKLSIIEAIVTPNYEELYPPLPFRKDNKTIFGNFAEKGIWVSAEIKYAMELGYKFKFTRALIFPEKGNPFIPFIDKMFKLKSESTGGMKKGAKIILNSSYGKFGQRVFQKQSVNEFFSSMDEALEFMNTKIDNDCNATMKLNEEYNQYCVTYDENIVKLQPFQMVHLSAFITAYARIELLKMIKKVSSAGYNVYYCDTDSIVTEINPIIPIGKNLGDWGIEHELKEFKCLAPKCYIAILKEDNELILKVKGVRKDKIKEIKSKCKSILDVIPFIEQPIEICEQYLPIKSSLKRFGSALSSAGVVKHLSLTNTKRKVTDSLETEPLR